MNNFKKLILITLTIIFFTQLAISAVLRQKIDVQGKGYKERASMFLINGMGYLNIRDVAKFYDGELEWMKINRNPLLKFKKGYAQFKLYDDVVMINDEKRTLRKAPTVLDDKFLVPLEVLLTRAFSEASGYKSKWHYDDKILRLSRYTYTNKELKKFVDSKDVLLTHKKDDHPAKIIPPAAQKETTTVNIRQYLSSQKKVIVVDPGHGGKDPGAVSKRGTKEKNVNLSISKKVANILKRKYMREVILTRDRDEFIALSDRVEIANNNNANLFVSIHANSTVRNDRRGFEIYFLSEKGSDEEAERVAQLENAALKYEDEIRYDVNSILWSMALNEFMNESSELCYFVSRSVDKNIRIQNHGVKQAAFHVLKGAKMPAVLVETGYLSNILDDKLLTNKKYQDKLAQTIAEGVVNFEKHSVNRETANSK
ncbi:N-acetylmuramoyl-L-alanine amidase [bacterium]